MTPLVNVYAHPILINLIIYWPILMAALILTLVYWMGRKSK